MSLTEHKVTLSQSVAKQQDAKWPFWCLASMLTISALLYSLDISVEVILWEAVEATIDEYPVFLLYLSQPSIWNTYQRVLFNRSRNIWNKLQIFNLISFEFIVTRWRFFLINLPFRKKLKNFLQQNNTFILFRKKFHEKEILFFNSVSGFLFHDRRDIWSSVLRANQINSENGKNKAN